MTNYENRYEIFYQKLKTKCYSKQQMWNRWTNRRQVLHPRTETAKRILLMLIFLNGICKGDMKEVSVLSIFAKGKYHSYFIIGPYCFICILLFCMASHYALGQKSTATQQFLCDKHDEFRYTQSTATCVRPFCHFVLALKLLSGDWS